MQKYPTSNHIVYEFLPNMRRIAVACALTAFQISKQSARAEPSGFRRDWTAAAARVPCGGGRGETEPRRGPPVSHPPATRDSRATSLSLRLGDDDRCVPSSTRSRACETLLTVMWWTYNLGSQLRSRYMHRVCDALLRPWSQIYNMEHGSRTLGIVSGMQHAT